MKETQFGLFQGPENVKSRDSEMGELERLLKPSVTTESDTRRAIVRGFLDLHFLCDVEILMERPLQKFGGFSLHQMIEKDWKMVQAWIQEWRLHRHEKNEFIAIYTQGD